MSEQYEKLAIGFSLWMKRGVFEKAAPELVEFWILGQDSVNVSPDRICDAVTAVSNFLQKPFGRQ